MAEKNKYLLVISNCPDSISATNIAQDLVSAKLAACANIIPGVESLFSWTGKVDKANEHMLIVKTTAACYDAVEQRIKNLHPYTLPEIIAIPIHTGSAEYLHWISTNTDNP